MYALPQQTLAMARHDVRRAIALAPAHISHYQLTLETGTQFAARPPAGIPDLDGAWDMQEACRAQLATAGYDQYETSAYARPGRQCAHNLNYWRFGDYLGIGAGAHGKLTLGASQQVLRRWKLRHPELYREKAGTADAVGGDEYLSAQRLPFDFMLNALRLNEGVPLPCLKRAPGCRGMSSPPGLPRPAPMAGWKPIRTVRPTELGRRFANDVIGLFLD